MRPGHGQAGRRGRVTGAALPIYWSLVFGSGRRLDRLRDAWTSYWALYRSLVIPACVLFGLVVFRLLAAG